MCREWTINLLKLHKYFVAGQEFGLAEPERERDFLTFRSGQIFSKSF